MQALLSAPAPVPLLSELTKPLVVVVAYDSIEAGRHAMGVYSRLVHDIDMDLQCQNMLLSFNLLVEPAFFEQAAEAASQADMLVIAASDVQPPPLAVRRWIENWLLSRAPDDGALVGIMGSRPEESPTQLPLHNYLANAAQKAGIPYFQGFFTVGTAAGSAFRELQAREPQLESVLDSTAGHSAWGINE